MQYCIYIPLGGNMCRWKDNVKMEIEGTGCVCQICWPSHVMFCSVKMISLVSLHILSVNMFPCPAVGPMLRMCGAVPPLPHRSSSQNEAYLSIVITLPVSLCPTIILYVTHIWICTSASTILIWVIFFFGLFHYLKTRNSIFK